MKKLLSIFIVVLVCLNAQAKELRPETLIFRPRMEYPLEARKQRMEGSGVYVLDVDRRGLVTAVHVAASSGHKLLDQSAIKVMRKFRFKPGCKPRVRIPARWSLSDTYM